MLSVLLAFTTTTTTTTMMVRKKIKSDERRRQVLYILTRMTHATTWFGFWTPTDLEQTVSPRNGLSMYLGPCLLAKMPPNGRAVCSIFEPTIQLTSGFCRKCVDRTGGNIRFPSLIGGRRTFSSCSQYVCACVSFLRLRSGARTPPQQQSRTRPVRLRRAFVTPPKPSS